ncbi:hypothetical protein A3B51_00545 [Candidatus Curtissbacteria bacterium RIFCSPLOWO2_01_FULL_41_18]|uniref:Uncharacterized protein n=2 Tax=Candidatus Curtissiibacteriota TaxID=1752717 RepID=A0A1F5G0D1_9BACT|nr:MAG: hypothetical protein A2696_02510 [Candidatus Curtissbacteria bacterium RIFCSPHIGHO2_01_FULL_41_13]OGE04955.1 MAG: hypothetical protein A3B51_00545 [Candidatus Curtissbacteria bacterium RIFCSPLOWO2_01_FULL_41_18]
MERKHSFIAVDIQNDFASEGGQWYTPKPAVDFMKKVLFPYLREKGIKINEIISDYRQPRPGDRGDGCHPGEWGYESLVPDDIRKSQWIKCMNSPIWTRDNIGDANREPGLPHPDPNGFGQWLEENVGSPEKTTPVLIGLTADCCVLSTGQELNWRGYYPLILREAVDHASGKIEDRDKVLDNPVSNWAKTVDWEELKQEL